MGNCDGCIFWEGNDSTYRAKCKKLSDEAQTVTTAFDETCPQFFARVADRPVLVMPNMQSNVRGIYTGLDASGPLTYGSITDITRKLFADVMRQTSTPDYHGDTAFDVNTYIRSKLLSAMADEEDRQIMGYPVTKVAELLPDIAYSPLVFGDFSDYRKKIEFSHFDAAFYSKSVTYPYLGEQNAFRLVRPRLLQSRVKGKGILDSTLIPFVAIGDLLDFKLKNQNGTEIDFKGRVTGMNWSMEYGAEVSFESENEATITHTVRTDVLPLDDEDEQYNEYEWEDLEGDDLEDDEEDSEKDSDKDDQEEGEGYGGNRRFYL